MAERYDYGRVALPFAHKTLKTGLVNDIMKEGNSNGGKRHYQQDA